MKVIVIFERTFKAQTAKTGVRKAIPLGGKCEQFADAYGLVVRCDHLGAFDGDFPLRVCFDVEGDDKGILLKMAALFVFAAGEELSLVNQTLYPEH